MQFIVSELESFLQAPTNLFLLPTNSTLNDKDELVFTGQLGSYLLDNYPQYPKIFGAAISSLGLSYLLGQDVLCYEDYYGCLLPKSGKWGLFQINRWYYEDVDFSLLEYSTSKLLQELRSRKDFRIDIPLFGHIMEEMQIHKTLSALPDSVYLWKI